MRVLDLFSGIGGFSLGLERAGMTTVAFCEIDPFCRRVLAKHWPGVPIFEDIRELDGDAIGHGVDLVCGGFPCQPWSLAGRRGGNEDDRHLWPEMRRVVGAVRPRWVIGENVPGLDDQRYMALDGVLADLEALGYQALPLEIPACAVDAPHLRKRLWIVAHTPGAGRDAAGCSSEAVSESGAIERSARCCDGDVADRDDARPQGHRRNGECAGECAAGQGGDERGAVECAEIVGWREGRPEHEVWSGRPASAEPGGSGWAAAEWIGGHDGKARRAQPGLRLLADGVPERVARLKALGNAVVPQVVERIGRAIMEAV